jgi:hypothetical protein
MKIKSLVSGAARGATSGATTRRAVSSVGRARALHARGRRFEPVTAHQSEPEGTPAPDLSRKLAHPIVLTRGPRSRIETLQDAATLIRDLDGFRQARPVWDRAAEMILIAAETGKRGDIAEARRQMLVALERENWWTATT